MNPIHAIFIPPLRQLKNFAIFSDLAAWVAGSESGGGGGSPITGYKVQWKETADSWDIPADVSETTVTATTHTITGLTGGVEYTVRVLATNAVNDGPWSASATSTPQAIAGPPTVDSVTPGDKTLTVAWSTPSDDGGAVITGYDLRYIRSDAPDKADANWTVCQGRREDGPCTKANWHWRSDY